MFQTGAAELAPVNQSVPLTAFTLTADLVFQGKKKKKKERECTGEADKLYTS